MAPNQTNRMKPNFALNLTHESIVLLHRTARGWLEVGSAALDDPDLGEALTYLTRRWGWRRMAWPPS